LQQRDGLLSGAYDLAVTAMDNTISWSRAAGRPFHILAQIERTTSLELYGRQPFKRPIDLRGARVGVDAPDSGFVLVLRGALELAGVKPNSYTLCPCGGVKERFEALSSGAVDATLLGPPLTDMAKKSGLNRIVEIDCVYPDYPGLGIVVSRDRMKALSPALSSYLAALADSLVWIEAHRQEFSNALVESGFSPDSIESVLASRSASLRPDEAGIRRILDLRKHYDPQFDLRTSPEDLIDESFLTQ
jgi:ABC-type nitrate/sulfonate/bicarbonate transport system substrate-binding protein